MDDHGTQPGGRGQSAGGHDHVDEQLVPLEEVQRFVLARCSRLDVVELPLADALGAVLADDLIVPEDLPRFANTAMDGYAVRAADVAVAPATLRVVGVLAAGDAPGIAVGSGEAVQIMTGAPIPPGADGIAIVERTERAGSEVRILEPVRAGACIRLPGSDYRAGEIALRAGEQLRPSHLGVAAMVGAASLRVVRRPRVGVLSTGDELVEAGVPLGPGQIRDSNRVALLALLRRDGFEPVDLGVVRDDEAAVEAAFRDACQRCDALLTSGGVSKGEFDYVKSVLGRLAAELGGEAVELSVAIRPAKPLALAWLPRPAGGDGSIVIFGLPGNPVSSMVSYEVVAAPGLRAMAGVPVPLRQAVPAVAVGRLEPATDGRLHLVRAIATVGEDGRITVRSAGGQASHQLSGTTAANALAIVPPGDPIEPGQTVHVVVFGDLT